MHQYMYPASGEAGYVYLGLGSGVCYTTLSNSSFERTFRNGLRTALRALYIVTFLTGCVGGFVAR
jgi:hypothetical protein